MERLRSYLGRSHRRVEMFFSETRSKACCEKSAEDIVPILLLYWEGLNPN